MDSEKTQLIKQMIQFRAKYRVPGGKRRYCPGRVVPHPSNRGGDPMAPTRLRELGGTLTIVGYDRVEANTNGVVVQQRPESPESTGKAFQEAYSLKIAADREVAEFGVKNMHAILGSLSHGHLNCLFRNVEAGVRGCECIELTVVGKNKRCKCTCKAKAILDEDGNYSMALLEGHDNEWHSEILTGLEWEELSWEMDVEEPDAALVISVALNKKNESAMNIGHLEIVAAMHKLLNPDPKDGSVAYEPVRDKLIELYGWNVDNPEFVFVYRFLWRQEVERVSFTKGWRTSRPSS